MGQWAIFSIVLYFSFLLNQKCEKWSNGPFFEEVSMGHTLLSALVAPYSVQWSNGPLCRKVRIAIQVTLVFDQKHGKGSNGPFNQVVGIDIEF